VNAQQLHIKSRSKYTDREASAKNEEECAGRGGTTCALLQRNRKCLKTVDARLLRDAVHSHTPVAARRRRCQTARTGREEDAGAGIHLHTTLMSLPLVSAATILPLRKPDSKVCA
jgi:hypothetical protein